MEPDLKQFRIHVYLTVEATDMINAVEQFTSGNAMQYVTSVSIREMGDPE